MGTSSSLAVIGRSLSHCPDASEESWFPQWCAFLLVSPSVASWERVTRDTSGLLLRNAVVPSRDDKHPVRYHPAPKTTSVLVFFPLLSSLYRFPARKSLYRVTVSSARVVSPAATTACQTLRPLHARFSSSLIFPFAFVHNMANAYGT